MSEDTLIETMNANKFMRSRAEVVAFEEAMAELAKHPKNQYLRPLHLVLDDRCEHHEVMYDLIHFLDYFDLKERLQAFIDVVPEMINTASEWTEILHYRILNDDSSRALYKELLHSANSESRDVVFQLLKEIANNESPPLSSLAEFVLAESATLVVSNQLIQRSPEILSATPVFAGTRVPVQTLIDYLEAGDSQCDSFASRIDDFLNDFPTVTRDQVTKLLKLALESLLSQENHESAA